MSVAGINGTANYPVYTPGKAKGNVSNNNFSQQINKTKAGSKFTLYWFDTPEGDKPLGALGDEGNSSITVYKPKNFDPENPVY
ncbi:MAG: hypothetical protein K2J04_12015, partial [Lachnospiraceae bacterium]|nr:hypothetical protein [Lachnospiraceae bacterium]